MPRREEEEFVWIPYDRTTKWDCTIAGTSVKDYILSGKFPMGIISEELVCEIELDNSGEQFNFSQGNIISFNLDLAAGTTKQFEGEIEEIKKDDKDGLFKLNIKGNHYTSQLLDVMVTEEYPNSAISTIRKNLIDKYLTGFTYANIETNSETLTIKFINKPLLDCFIDLDTIGDEDTYVDNAKDVHTFKKGSKVNDNDAVVMNDSLISLEGLGSDSADVRNKITVYGESGGLPVIHTSEDANSQTAYRTKERIITDTSLDDEDKASSYADGEKEEFKDPIVEGSAECFIMPFLIPAYMTYVIYPPHNIHSRYRVIKYVHKVPNENTEVYLNSTKTISKLFKDRMKKEMGQENINNPHKMKYSYNFTFDNESKIDISASSSYLISESKIRKDSSVESATIISNAKDTPITVSSVHILAIGEVLDGATYWVQANPSAVYQQITLNTLTTVTSTGTELRLKIIITDNNTRIDSIVILYR